MKLDEDSPLLRLYCSKCENTECLQWKKLGYIYENSKQGCSRKISWDVFNKYEHYINEIIPFWRVIHNQKLISEQYQEIINFFDIDIFSVPIENFYDAKGKVANGLC